MSIAGPFEQSPFRWPAGSRFHGVRGRSKVSADACARCRYRASLRSLSSAFAIAVCIQPPASGESFRDCSLTLSLPVFVPTARRNALAHAHQTTISRTAAPWVLYPSIQGPPTQTTGILSAPPTVLTLSQTAQPRPRTFVLNAVFQDASTPALYRRSPCHRHGSLPGVPLAFRVHLLCFFFLAFQRRPFRSISRR
ncbi:hypothetical protein BD414DRAFT_186570 [Trametes punicea]|nr:hypothetical protein BD414DRAFT_186570 [Trametes punicea]